MNNDEVFFVGQKALIERDGKVLVLTRSGGGLLDLPGGKVQAGETDHIEALKREVREETGLEIEAGGPVASWISSFAKEHRNADKKIFMIVYLARYKSGEVVLSSEHNSFRWVGEKDLRDLPPGGHRITETLKNYFAKRA
ncbi:MAG: NUDIX domain-containing protein [Minisyncoccia bacterium]